MRLGAEMFGAMKLVGVCPPEKLGAAMVATDNQLVVRTANAVLKVRQARRDNGNFRAALRFEQGVGVKLQLLANASQSRGVDNFFQLDQHTHGPPFLWLLANVP